jgi:hypothetical protein
MPRFTTDNCLNLPHFLSSDFLAVVKFDSKLKVDDDDQRKLEEEENGDTFLQMTKKCKGIVSLKTNFENLVEREEKAKDK